MGILVTGAAGQLGSELVRQFGDAAIACESSTLDVTNSTEVTAVVEDVRPDAVINCAAYTQVDRAEQESAVCNKVNATGVANLASACSEIDATLIQLSTDYVFGADASRQIPYAEDDVTGPQGVYARSKLEGEVNAQTCPRHFIVRTCGLYGRTEAGGNFVETMLRLGSQGKPLRVVDDQICSPTYTAHLADAMLRLIKSPNYGVYHIVNAGKTTWFEFAREIFLQSNIEVSLHPISTEQFGAAAPRPRYSVLDAAKYQEATGHILPSWRQALAEYLAAR